MVAYWQTVLNCGEKCKEGGSTEPLNPCKDYTPTPTTTTLDCKLVPALTLPICNDAYYLWVNDKYKNDVKDADDLADELVEVNKKKESLSACKTSLETAIKEVDAQQICK